MPPAAIQAHTSLPERCTQLPEARCGGREMRGWPVDYPRIGCTVLPARRDHSHPELGGRRITPGSAARSSRPEAITPAASGWEDESLPVFALISATRR